MRTRVLSVMRVAALDVRRRQRAAGGGGGGVLLPPSKRSTSFGTSGGSAIVSRELKRLLGALGVLLGAVADQKPWLAAGVASMGSTCEVTSHSR